VSIGVVTMIDDDEEDDEWGIGSTSSISRRDSMELRLACICLRSDCHPQLIAMLVFFTHSVPKQLYERMKSWWLSSSLLSLSFHQPVQLHSLSFHLQTPWPMPVPV